MRIALSLQHLLAMFGATILVPILTGLPISVALFTSGVGTLIFSIITKAQIPAYLGSSFAFIAPIIAISANYGASYAMGGTIFVGLAYCGISFLVKKVGTDFIRTILPPVVTGSVIIVIGLGLASVGVDMAGLTGEGSTLGNVAVQVSLFTLLVTVLASVFLKGFLGVLPILIGIVSGYTFSLMRGIINFTPVLEANWIGFPDFIIPTFSLTPILIMLPVALVTIAEHLGDIMVIGTVVGKPFIKEPGLHRTLLGDGMATAFAGFFGGPPNTTYGENVGVLAFTKNYDVKVIQFAAFMAVVLAYIPKVSALLSTIPVPVMGGVCIVLFGVIASSGIRTLVENQVDFSDKKNLAISSVILVIGIGGANLNIGNFYFGSMVLAVLAGILLNLVFEKGVK